MDLLRDSTWTYGKMEELTQVPPLLPYHSIIAFISDQLIRLLGGGSSLFEPSSPPAPPSDITPTSPRQGTAGEESKKSQSEEVSKSTLLYNVMAKRNSKLRMQMKGKKTPRRTPAVKKRPPRRRNCSVVREKNPSNGVVTRSRSLRSTKNGEKIRRGEKRKSRTSRPRVAARKTAPATYDINTNPAYLTRHYIKQWIERSLQEQAAEDRTEVAEKRGSGTPLKTTKQIPSKTINKRRTRRNRVYTVKDYIYL